LSPNAKQFGVLVSKETWQKRLDLLNRTKFIHQLEGYIHFVGQVREKYDPLYTKYKASFDGVFALE
jgi:hypothetical protein